MLAEGRSTSVEPPDGRDEVVLDGCQADIILALLVGEQLGDLPVIGGKRPSTASSSTSCFQSFHSMLRNRLAKTVSCFSCGMKAATMSCGGKSPKST